MFASHANILLSQVTSPSIEIIKLGIRIFTLDELEAIDWRLLAQSVTQSRFSQLPTVELSVDGNVDKSMAADFVRAKLSACGSREINLICSYIQFYCFSLRLTYRLQEQDDGIS